MLRKILIGVGIAIVLFVILVATRPSTFRVERSASLAAAPETVFAQVNDFHAWPAWSPWERLDPAMKRTYGGSPAGAGATYAWVGNDDVGQGRMTIEKSEPDEQIVIKLEFIEPFETSSTIVFDFARAGSGTKVTWAMEGNNDFFGKLFSLFMDMDELVGNDFEKGLVALKTVAEAASKVNAAAAAP